VRLETRSCVDELMELVEFLPRVPRGDLWVFGYGSLMWSPHFQFVERSPAMLHGYHRALCILSRRYRGTEAKPGLVMGLCRGGSCWGMAFRVAHNRVPATLHNLWRREMPRKVYDPRLVSVRVGRGRLVQALAFVAAPGHPSVVRELDLESRAALVAQGIGERGPCTEYVRNTLEHMYEIGVHDPHLARVLETAEAIRNRASSRRTR
jgi:cation transport protein ChaC